MVSGLLPCATAQDDSADHSATKKSATNEKDKPKVVHYVRTVPRTPADYHPITAEQRLGWFTRATTGPRSLFGGVLSSAFGTATNRPPEYGTDWEGFGQRYGMRLTGVSTGNAIEAVLGSAWGEDPRYFRTIHHPVGDRLKNAADLTFRAYRNDGERHPAFARYIAELGNNFLSNTWRVRSEADPQHALIRTGEGFAGRFVSNMVMEFVPELWRRARRRTDPYGINTRYP